MAKPRTEPKTETMMTTKTTYAGMINTTTMVTKPMMMTSISVANSSLSSSA